MFINQLIELVLLQIEFAVAALVSYKIEMQIAVPEMAIAANTDCRIDSFDGFHHILVERGE